LLTVIGFCLQSTHYKPTGKKDGSVDIGVRVNPNLDDHVNAGFRGKWIDISI
jgi:hypothetical protein